jgi:hypothetical protein
MVTLARTGQAYAFAVPGGQAYAQRIFQDFHLLAHRSGRNTQAFGCF